MTRRVTSIADKTSESPVAGVYVFGNLAMPGLYKIGRAGDVAARRKKLSNGTMVADKFHLEALYPSDEPERLESRILAYLGEFRYTKDREFFKINAHKIRR